MPGMPDASPGSLPGSAEQRSKISGYSGGSTGLEELGLP